MIWLTWRQFRTQAASAYAAVAAVLVVLAVTGPRLADLARGNTDVLGALPQADSRLFYAGIVLLALAPAGLGAFWGAPLVARELEAGTHRLVWNQSVTRTRWLATKLACTAVAGAGAVGLLTLAVTWWSAPVDTARLADFSGAVPSRMTSVAFAMRGIVPVAYAVFAIVLGVAIGAVLRRALAAMAVTLVVFTAVQIAVPLWLRPHFAEPLRETVTISVDRLDGLTRNGPDAPIRLKLRSAGAGDWVLSNRTVDAAGRAVALPAWMDDCLPKPPGMSTGDRAPVADPRTAIGACLERLSAEGYRQQIVYHPASRFWTLQWVETGLYLALSAVLAGFCFWWTRRRLS